MAYDKVMDAWYYDLPVEVGIKQVNVAFGDGTNMWDDNSGKNWNINIRPDTNPPGKVQNFAAKPKAKQIMLSWDKNSESDMSGYNIFRGKYKVNLDGLITDNKFEDTIGLEEGKDYEYRIVAVDKSGNIGPESVLTAGTLKDLISVPEIVYTADSRTQQLRLMASVAKVVNWQLEIFDSTSQVIRTYSGRGDVVVVLWNLQDSKGARVKPGSYKYKVTVMDDETILPRDVEIQVF